MENQEIVKTVTMLNNRVSTTLIAIVMNKTVEDIEEVKLKYID